MRACDAINSYDPAAAGLACGPGSDISREPDHGQQRSNRRVPADLLGGLEKDEPALGFLIEQDREIAEKSGRAPLAIKSVARTGGKPKKAMLVK